ncbi:MAG: hypothetical protein WEA10_02860 [Actinomycetota bacterium]
MHRVVTAVVLALVAAGCRGATGDAPSLVAGSAEGPSAFAEVVQGRVRALVPERWRTSSTDFDLHRGIAASPQPGSWGHLDGSVAGMSATYIDATDVGVPSDYYYLAATGSALSQLTHSGDCRASHRRVLVNNRPGFFRGDDGSTGDYLAVAEGACRIHNAPTRWAYFVAAPGYGSMRRIGIPTSGLYVVVAVLPASRRAHGMLRTLVRGARFGTAGVNDFLAIARDTPA